MDVSVLLSWCQLIFSINIGIAGLSNKEHNVKEDAWHYQSDALISEVWIEKGKYSWIYTESLNIAFNLLWVEW